MRALVLLSLVGCSSPSPVAPNSGSIPFHVYEQPWGARQPGDELEITELRGAKSGCVVGEEYEVSGQYALASHASAQIAVFATNGKLALATKNDVVAGKGTFKLRFVIEKPGQLHVTYYPTGGGNGFGGPYFACD
jgi:hypothetical protein